MTLFIIGLGLLRILVCIFMVLLIIKAVSIAGKKIRAKQSKIYKEIKTSEAIKPAALRFANGDISADQYKEIKTVLENR